ncbi:MAG: hypothetical protein ACYC2Y_05575 [Armatimonadota bacterium]
MKKFAYVLIASIVLSVALAAAASAFTMQEKVVVANELVAIARVSAGGFTAQERIDRVNERLAYILGYESLTPRSIYAVPRGGSRMIMVGNELLITVTPRDAAANNTTVAGLTRIWLANAEAAIPEARPMPTGQRVAALPR